MEYSRRGFLATGLALAADLPGEAADDGPPAGIASANLAARGGVLVTASMKSGVIEFVELESLAGGECRGRNPWTGEVHRYAMRKGERVTVKKV